MRSKTKICRAIGINAYILLGVFLGWPGHAMEADLSPHLKKIRTLESKTAVTGAAWSSDGSMLASYSDFGQLVTVWLSDGTHIRDIDRANGEGPYIFPSIVFLPNGRLLLPYGHGIPIAKSSDSKQAFTIWNIETGKVERDIPGPAPNQPDIFNHPKYYVLSPDGETLAYLSGQPNDDVTLYETHNWSVLRRIPIVTGVKNSKTGDILTIANSVAFSPDGNSLAVGLIDGKVQINNLRYLEAAPRIITVYTPPVSFSCKEVSFSPDGQFLAVGAYAYSGAPNTTADISRASVKVIRVSDNELQSSYLDADPVPVRQLTWSIDSHHLAVATVHRDIRIFTPADPLLIGVSTQLEEGVSSINFSPKDHSLAVAAGTAVIIFSVLP